MARNTIIREPRPKVPPDPSHGCYDGVVYIGHLVIGEDGDEAEVIEAVPCRRCADVPDGNL
jgi:hypothetical protein